MSKPTKPRGSSERKAKAKAKSPEPKAPKVKKPKVGMTLRCGAVSAYTPELAAEIAWRTAEGKSLRAIAADPDMPGLRTITDWQNAHPEFARMLDRARLVKADRRLERIDEYSRQVVEGTLDPHRGKVAIDAEKWAASKENWGRYGDKQGLAVAAVPTPDETAHAGSSSTAEELLAHVTKLARNMRRGMTPQQVQEMEARALNGEAPPPQTVEAEVLPTGPPSRRPEIAKAADAGPWEPPADLDEKLVDVTPPSPIKKAGEFAQLKCTSVRPDVLDRDRYAFPQVISNDYFGLVRRR
jgi:terminase small subunit-like protein